MEILKERMRKARLRMDLLNADIVVMDKDLLSLKLDSLSSKNQALFIINAAKDSLVRIRSFTPILILRTCVKV